jgi:hypothetical protein
VFDLDDMGDDEADDDGEDDESEDVHGSFSPEFTCASATRIA